MTDAIECYMCPSCGILGTMEQALLGLCWGAGKRRRDCPLPQPLPPELTPERNTTTDEP
jgi:hypothetical protein